MECIVAVSGGSDSMALVDWLEEQGKDYVVCHVNYGVRPTADRDEGIVREWCNEHDRPFRVLYPQYTKGNFEAWAREVRYQFFKETAKEFGVNTLYVGHHQGDLLETWFMQKERGIVSHYGLKEVSDWQGMTIVRPLLQYTKQELEDRCNSKGIQWGLDETNLSNDYTRNRIRHTLIEPSTNEQREEWLKQIDEDNKNLKQMRDHLKEMNDEDIFSDGVGWYYLSEKLTCTPHPTKKSLKDAIEKLSHGRKVVFGDKCVSYSTRFKKLEVETIEPQVTYPTKVFCCMDELVGYACDEYTITNTGTQMEAFYVDATDFPLTIRAPKQEDQIQMRYGTKKVSKLLRDKGINQKERNTIAVVESYNKGIIFVERAGCSLEDYHKGQELFLKGSK